MKILNSKIQELLDQAIEINSDKPEAARDLCLSALKIAKDKEDYKLEGEVYLQLIKAYRLISSYEEALDCADSARRIFTMIGDDNGLMRLNNLIGILYYYNGIYELALQHLDASFKVAERQKNNKLMMATLNNIAEVKKKAGDLDEAMRIYNRSLEMAQENKLSMYYGVIIQNIGDVHMLMGDLESAESCFHEAYSSFVEEKDTANLSELFINLGRLYNMQNYPTRAKSFFETAVSMLEEVQNKFYILDGLIELYKLELVVDPTKALTYLKKARMLAEKAKIELKLSEIELLLNKHYENSNDYERALYHFKRYHNLIQKLDANNLILKLKILKLEKGSLSSYEVADPVSELVNEEIELEKEKLKTLEKINSELKYQAYHDNLTKLANRRKIDSELNRISDAVKESESGLKIGIFMMDIDHFKLVNDHMGHLFGDRCLKAIGGELTRIAEKYGAFVGRYGGEEFIFLKEDLDLYLANKIAHDLNESIRKLEIEYDIVGDKKQLTISVGGLYCECIEAFHKLSLIELADKALYIAKAEGRDKSVLHIHKDIEDISLEKMSN